MFTIFIQCMKALQKFTSMYSTLKYVFIFFFYSTIISQIRENTHGVKKQVEDGTRVNELYTIILRIIEIITDVLEILEITTESLSLISLGEKKAIYSYHTICHNVNKNFATYFWMIQLYGKTKLT